MKKLLLSLVLTLVMTVPAFGAELGEYLRQIDMYNQMLTELKATDDFARLGFAPAHRDAVEWLAGAEKLREAIAGEKFPYQVTDAPQVMIDLAHAYAGARKNGFANAAALNEYEETVCIARIRINNAIHFNDK